MQFNNCKRCQKKIKKRLELHFVLLCYIIAMNSIVPIPSRFRIKENKDGIIVSFRWFRLVHLLYLPFAVFLNGFLLNWYAKAFQHGDIVAMLFCIPHTYASVTLSYLAISGLTNTTTIKISPDNIKIIVSPISFVWENKTFKTKELRHIDVVEEKSMTKRGQNYTIEAIDFYKGGVKILSLETLEEALFLEDKIKAFCELSSAPIARN